MLDNPGAALAALNRCGGPKGHCGPQRAVAAELSGGDWEKPSEDCGILVGSFVKNPDALHCALNFGGWYGGSSNAYYPLDFATGQPVFDASALKRDANAFCRDRYGSGYKWAGTWTELVMSGNGPDCYRDVCSPVCTKSGSGDEDCVDEQCGVICTESKAQDACNECYIAPNGKTTGCGPPRYSLSEAGQCMVEVRCYGQDEADPNWGYRKRGCGGSADCP